MQHTHTTSLGSFLPSACRRIFSLAITVSVRWIGRLIGKSLTLILAHTAARHQGRIIVQRFAHLVAYYIHQRLEHRLLKGEKEEERIDHVRVTSRQAGSISARSRGTIRLKIFYQRLVKRHLTNFHESL